MAALPVFEKGDQALFLSRCYQQLGMIMAAKSRPEEAIAYSQKALALIKQAGTRENYAYQLMSLGLVLSTANDTETALQYLEDAVAVYQKVRSLQGMALCFDAIATVNRKSGRLEAVVKYFTRSVETRESLGDKAGLCESYFNLASTYKEMGNYKPALELFGKAFILAGTLGMTARSANYLSSRGQAYLSLGDNDRALSDFRGSMEIHERLVDRRGIANDLIDLGSVHFRQGFFNHALDEYERAYSIFEERHDEHGMAMASMDTGQLYMAWGRPDQALSHFQKSLKIFEQGSDSLGVLLSLLNMCGPYAKLSRYLDALECGRRALEISQALGIQEHVAGSYCNLGAISEALGLFDEASRYYVEGYAIFEKSGYQKGIAQLTYNLGHINYLLQRNQLAQVYLRKALDINQNIGDLAAVARTLDHLSVIDIDLGHFESAIESLARSIAIKERLRQTAHPSLRRDYISAENESYEAITYAYSMTGEASAALAYAELASTKSLVDQLTTQDVSTDNSLPNVQSLLRSIDDSTLVVVYHNLDRVQSFAFVIWRGSVRVVRFTKEDFVQKVSAELGSLLSINPPMGKPSETKTTPISPDPLNAAFIKIILRYQQLLAHPEVSETYSAAAKRIGGELFALLLSPILQPGTEVRRIVIVPDGALTLVPFETLVMPEGRYLVEQFDVTYAPSLRVKQLAEFRTPKTGRKGLLAIGGAAYTKATYNQDMALSEAALASLRATSSLALRGGRNLHEFYDTLGYASWSNLPGSLAEVKKIATFFDTSDIYVGLQASESVVKSLSAAGTLSGYRVLHFATHAFALSALPELSAIVLSESASSDGTEDGYLTQAEVAALRTDADLVVLSACETALGAYYRGEGMVGLMQAFLIAGARGVCSSLWQISDEAALHFMADFYRLAEESGVRYAAALNQIKREFICSGKYSHPFYWGAFVYYGD